MSAEPAFPPDQTLDGVLHRMSTHLDGLASLAHEVEHAIADERGAQPSNAGSDRVARLQNLDFLRQYTEDLALLTLHLSQLDVAATRIPGHQIVKLSQRIRLERTRALLFAQADPVGAEAPSITTGDIDLF